MKSTELRIGNYVNAIDRRTNIHLPTNIPLKVLQIEIFNCEVLQTDKNPATEEKWIKISNCDLSPIPLTEEWLIKFGFEIKNYSYTNSHYVKGKFGFDLTTFEYKGIKLKYVHQLQNLFFALTCEELQTQAGGV